MTNDGRMRDWMDLSGVTELTGVTPETREAFEKAIRETFSAEDLEEVGFGDTGS